MTPQRTADLGFARLDLDRAERTGTPEVVYAAGKTPAQTVDCLAALHEGGGDTLAPAASDSHHLWSYQVIESAAPDRP